MATLELWYETAATLMLRGVLDPEVPAHEHIIERFAGGYNKHGSWYAAPIRLHILPIG